MSSTISGFEWPWLYNFPPFYTVQPNESTRIKQLDSWCSLVISYCRENHKYEINVKQAQLWPLFHNSHLNRKLSEDGITLVLDELAADNKFNWHDKKDKKAGYVMWYSLDDWANIIYDYAAKRGLRNTVCTFPEILECPTAKNMEKNLLHKILKRLESQNKAELIMHHDLEGIKFF